MKASMTATNDMLEEEIEHGPNSYFAAFQRVS